MSSDKLPVYEYGSRDLYEMTLEVGLFSNVKSAEQFFIKMRRENKFTPPVQPNNKRGDWMFSKEQMVEILKAFLPGGSGEWHFS